LHYCRSHCTYQIQSTHSMAASYPPPPAKVLLRSIRCISITFVAPQSPSAHLNPLGAFHSGLLLRYFIQRSIQPFLCTLLLQDGRSSIPSSSSIRSTSIEFETLYLPDLSALLTLDGLLRCIGAPQSQSVLLGLDLGPSHSFGTPPSPSALPLLTEHTRPGSSAFLVVHLFFPSNSSYYLSNSILLHHKLTSIRNLLDVTNRAKQPSNSISPTCQTRIIWKYKDRLQLVCPIDE
jgi:hypothetical protein